MVSDGVFENKTNTNGENQGDEFDIESLLEAPYQKRDATNAVEGNVQVISTASNEPKKEKESKNEGSKKSKKKKKDRSRSRSRSRDRKRKRSRSRDRKRRRSSSSRSRTRSSSRSRRRRSRSRSHRHRSRSRSRRTSTREKSPEFTPEERDRRTIFVMQLSQRIRPRDLEEFFTSVGKIRDVRLITDPRTKRSKGIAYIEFRDIESVPLAIALSGTKLLGIPMIIQPSFGEKNRIPGPVTAQAHMAINIHAPFQIGPMKLYVGSLHINITEDMLQQIFEPFGKINNINLIKDEFGHSKGYGFIEFAHTEDAKKAMTQLNGFELAGRAIKVSTVTESAKESSSLDSDEADKTGINLGTSGKLALMAKLAEGTGMKVPQYTLDALNMSTAVAANISQTIYNNSQKSTSPMIPLSTQCLIVSNMFDLNEEISNQNWVTDLKDDLINECNKHGGLVHCEVDTTSKEGNVYIKCPSVNVALVVSGALNGRFFGGRMIKTAFIPITNYHQLFPESECANHLLKVSK